MRQNVDISLFNLIKTGICEIFRYQYNNNHEDLYGNPNLPKRVRKLGWRFSNTKFVEGD